MNQYLMIPIIHFLLFSYINITNIMISRYPIILALVVAMAAMPSSTGRLVGNANNNANKANTLDAAQEELQKVNSDISS